MGLSLPLIKPGDDLPSMLLKAAERVGGLCDGDVIVISSKAVATADGMFREISKISPSARAKKISKKSGQPPEFVELVLREADEVLKVCKGAILTIKDGIICANAGADLSNAPEGEAILMPANANRSAEELRQALKIGSGKKTGVIISDSVVHPLRLGTVGQAVGTAGIEPVLDYRGQLDLYRKPLRITFRAIADQLASAAEAVMGEADERTPAVIVRNAPVKLVGKSRLSPKISPRNCIYYGDAKL